MKHKAYLIVICDNVTNEIKIVDIWSSPEWEQSRQLPARVFIAYEFVGDTFQNAMNGMLKQIEQPTNRYHYLYTIYISKQKEHQ